MDDGPASMAESLDMARQAVSDGIQGIVATPHTLNGVYDNPYTSVQHAVNQFRGVLADNGLALDIYPGTDTHFAIEMLDKISHKAAVTINGAGHYLLIELPHHAVPIGAAEALFELSANNITPIITHPERNSIIQGNLDILYDYVAMGCLIQVTAMSITGEFGEKCMQSAHKILTSRLAHIIASDAHNATSRPPVLSPAVKRAARILGSREEAEAMVCHRPRTIIQGGSLNIPDPIRPRRRWWWFA